MMRNFILLLFFIDLANYKRLIVSASVIIPLFNILWGDEYEKIVSNLFVRIYISWL